MVRLNDRLVPLLGELRALSSCTSRVLVPFAESEIPSLEAGNTGQEARRQILRSFVGLAGESRVHDANTPVFHIQGVLPGKLGGPTGRIEPAAPFDPNVPPVHRPDVPCETQEPPNLDAPGGPVADYSAMAPGALGSGGGG
jgi:phospholipid/cholesterol/gamma-HCH transport system substrate-binding protein